MRLHTELARRLRRVLRGRFKGPLRLFFAAAPVISGFLVVGLGAIALIPEQTRSEWPYTWIVIAVAALSLIFSILGPAGTNTYRQMQARLEQGDRIWAGLRRAFRARTDSWWRVAGNARGRTNPTELLTMFSECNELSPDEGYRETLKLLCDPAAYGTRAADAGDTELRACVWRPMPLDALEAEDPQAVQRCRQQLGLIHDLRLGDHVRGHDPNRGFFSWTESEGERKYVLVTRCFCGDKLLYGYSAKRPYLNEIAARGSAMEELWLRAVTEDTPWTAAAFGNALDRVRDSEKQLGQRDGHFGLSHATVGSVLMVRINRHNTSPRQSPRRDLLGIVTVYATNPQFFKGDDADEIVQDLEAVFCSFQLLAGESDSMGVFQRKAGYELPRVDRPRFGYLLSLAGAREQEIEAALGLQRSQAARRATTMRLGDAYLEVSNDQSKVIRVKDAERLMKPVGHGGDQPPRVQ